MELRHLRYFIAAAEEEHFARAADRLCVTRPAVSQIIADLEAELGTSLFERLAHGVKLTAAGRLLLPRLQTMMGELNEALVMTKLVGQGKVEALNVGYGSLTLMHSLFSAAIKQFSDSCPDVRLSLIPVPTSEQPQAFAEERIHAGFMHLASERPLLGKRRGGDEAPEPIVALLEWVPIESGGLGVALHEHHRLAQRKSVVLADLSSERFVAVPRSLTSGYRALQRLYRDAGFEPQIVQEVSTIAMQLNLVSAGMGIGLVTTGKNLVYPNGLTVLPLADVDYPTDFVFAWIKGRRHPALDRMIETVEALACRVHGQNEEEVTPVRLA